jgi:hypothetical protein
MATPTPLQSRRFGTSGKAAESDAEESGKRQRGLRGGLGASALLRGVRTEESSSCGGGEFVAA